MCPSDRTCTMSVKDALLVYASHQERFITRHAVMVGNDKVPSLGPAQPLTSEFVESLARSILGAKPLELLPDNVLAAGNRSIVWWSKPCCRQMFYASADGACADLNGLMFPQPALVWKVNHGELTVRALVEAKRPTRETTLAVAPFWNVSGEGRVCAGSMRRPNQVGAAGVADWERAFYESAFTHSNAGRLVRGEGGFEGLWRKLTGRKRFPAEMLIPLPETLAQFVGGRN